MRAGKIIQTLVSTALVAGVVASCSAGVKDDDTATVDSSSRRSTTTGNEPTTTTTTEQASDTNEEADGAMLLIMDASGSMNADDGNGQPLIDGAKQALHGVVDALPDETHVGLRVYGHRYPNTDRTNGCRDTELIQPVERLDQDRDAMLAAIDGYQAVGFTPIGYSLQEAVKDLPPEGPRTIVLVSDGEDTCAPPDPCEVAADVRAEGVDLVIHTVGFALPDQASRDQLQCIADAGGGEFHDAANAADLATTLEDVSVRESRRYQPTGTALAGSPIPRDAATGQLDTSYTDTALGAETNYYRFEIEPGSKVTAEVIVTGKPGYSDLLCPNVYLTDKADNSYSNAPFPGGSASETYDKVTEPVVVDDDEVWVKLETSNCRGDGSGDPNLEFGVELEVTADAP